MNPETANDILNDHTRIVKLIFAKHVLEIVKIIFQLLIVTFITGNILYILIDAFDMMEDDEHYSLAGDNSENMIGTFAFYSDPITTKSIKMTYYTFTTLSTVGFGDIHPRSNFERILSAITMLVGVLVFSIVRDKLIESIDFTMHIDDDFDDGIELTRFFGILRHYNRE